VLVFGVEASPPMIVQTGNAMLIYALILFGGLVLLVTDPELLLVTEGGKPLDLTPNRLSPAETVLISRPIGSLPPKQFCTIS